MVPNKAKKIDIKFLFVSIFLPILLLTPVFGHAKKQEAQVNGQKATKTKHATKEQTSAEKKAAKKAEYKAKQQEAKKKRIADKAKKPKKKVFRDLDYEDLKKGKEKFVAQGQKDVAIKHIEKMIPLCDNIQELRDLAIELSDLLFDTGELKKAATLYSQFCQEYPGDKNIEYANYRAILCNYWLTLDKERDQSSTKNTITMAKGFLDRSEIFKEYTEDVEKILADCQGKLLESEINIFKEYLNLGDQLSAKTRLACIEKDFSDQISGLEPRLLALSCAYAEKFNDQNLLDLKQKELNTKFPQWIDEPIMLANANPTSLKLKGVSSKNKADAKSKAFVDKF